MGAFLSMRTSKLGSSLFAVGRTIQGVENQAEVAGYLTWLENWA